MAANPEYANGEVIANKFVVEGFLGESPSSRMYVAAGAPGSQRAAVKVYKSEISERLLAAPDFFLKAGVMTEIEHDNLCSCFDVQEEMGKVFVARAFGEGMSFEEWVRKHRLEPNYFTRGLELLWQATQGLAVLHERTRHLNIHPGNVIVGPLVAKLCDWDPRALGSVELIPESLPVRLEFQGYRAPEASQRAGFVSYPSTDLYAIAALLFRVVKGDHPTPDHNRTWMDARGLDKDVAQFLSKALHPKPEERFQEAGAFSDSLWDLQGAMQRLQEQTRGKGGSGREAAPRREDPPAAAAAATSHRGNVTLPLETPMRSEQADMAGTTFFGGVFKDEPGEPKKAGDTLFGAPPVKAQPPQFQYAPPQPSFAPPPPRPAPPPPPPPPPRSGLEALEGSGTVFGSGSGNQTSFGADKPLFGGGGDKTSFGADKTSFGGSARGKEPQQSKPLPVSLSSLESDPMDMTHAGDAGFTQYGFKGAGEGRTGEFRAQREPGSAKRKLGMLLIGAGALVLIVGLGLLFLYLRQSASEHAAENAAQARSAAPASDPAPASAPTPSPRSDAQTPAADAPPYPEEASPSSAAPSHPAPTPRPTPAPAQERPRPAPKADNPPPQPKPASKPPAAPYKPSSITLERQAELERMVGSREWPATAAERLRAGDELNDLGKTAEANMLYSKSLLASDVTPKQKILAFGGLAVTFQKMGMNDQALDAVNRLLEINPRNSFALKLKEQLK